MTTAAPALGASTWAVQSTAVGFRLVAIAVRSPGPGSLTWAELLSSHLLSVRVFVLYFPSRFDLEVDTSVRLALDAFGRQTSSETSVSCWDPADPYLEQALRLFDIAAPPALVLATGLKKRGKQLLKVANLYAITVTQTDVLRDRQRLAVVVNGAHEVLMRGDAGAIASYVRKRDRESLLAGVAAVGQHVVEQLAILKPKFQLPGGISLQLG